jgi:ATP-dependent RNA helicase DDX51/DBP6
VGNEPVSKRPKQENQEKLSKQKRTELVMYGNQGKQLEEIRGGSFEMLEPKKSALRIRDSGGKHSAELQELGEVDSLQSLGVAGTDDGLAATTSKKERRKKKSKSSEGRADNANSDKFSDCGAKESLHGSDTPKRRNKTHENSDNTFELDEGVGTDAKDVGSRHKKLMEKREKSLKKAERFVQETTTESAGENLELGPVEELPTHLHDLVPLPQPDPVLEPPIVYSASSLPSWLSSPIRVSPQSRSLRLALKIALPKCYEIWGLTRPLPSKALYYHFYFLENCISMGMFLFRPQQAPVKHWHMFYQ